MITIIYGERCGEIVKYVNQTNEIVPFLRTIEILNFSIPHSECKSSGICIMQYCAMYCKQYDAPVCSRQGDRCFAHNYNPLGGWDMKIMDEVWLRHGFSFVKGK